MSPKKLQFQYDCRTPKLGVDFTFARKQQKFLKLEDEEEAD